MAEMHCCLCESDVPRDHLASHIFDFHCGPLEDFWQCGECWFRSRDVNAAALHCVSARHSGGALTRHHTNDEAFKEALQQVQSGYSAPRPPTVVESAVVCSRSDEEQHHELQNMQPFDILGSPDQPALPIFLKAEPRVESPRSLDEAPPTPKKRPRVDEEQMEARCPRGPYPTTTTTTTTSAQRPIDLTTLEPGRNMSFRSGYGHLDEAPAVADADEDDVGDASDGSETKGRGHWNEDMTGPSGEELSGGQLDVFGEGRLGRLTEEDAISKSSDYRDPPFLTANFLDKRSVFRLIVPQIAEAFKLPDEWIARETPSLRILQELDEVAYLVEMNGDTSGPQVRDALPAPATVRRTSTINLFVSLSTGAWDIVSDGGAWTHKITCAYRETAGVTREVWKASAKCVGFDNASKFLVQARWNDPLKRCVLPPRTNYKKKRDIREVAEAALDGGVRKAISDRRIGSTATCRDMYRYKAKLRGECQGPVKADARGRVPVTDMNELSHA